jgi:adenosine kinase
MKIICTGSIAFDVLMTFPGYFKDHLIPEKLECVSLSFLVDSMVRLRGGVAPNIAYTLALLGEKPLLMGTVGEDFAEYRAWLEKAGVDTTHAKVIEGDYTASFFANTDRINAQIASFYPGAMAHAAIQSIHDVLAEKPGLVVISPNDPRAMDKFVAECKELKIPYLYDPSQQLVRMDSETIRRGVQGSHCLFVNDYEFELIKKHTGMELADLLKEVDFMVVTLGAKGSVIYAEGKGFNISVVPPVSIVDPTGVGDAFRGGFLKGYSMKLDWQTCGQMGALAACYCLEQRGPQTHSYTPAEFTARYRQHFDDQGALNALL